MRYPEFRTPDARKDRFRVTRILSVAFFAGLFLSGCNMMNQTVTLTVPSTGLSQETLDKMPLVTGQQGTDHHLAAGLRALGLGKTDEAQGHFNSGLKFDPQHPHLHFLNALIYHQRANAGNSTQYELAEVGYRLALKFEPSHWLAAYQLGKLYMGQQQYRSARDAFSQALLIEPDNPSIAYGLATASYTIGEPETAHVVLQRLPQAYQKHPAVLRAMMLTEASLGNIDKSRQFLDAYRQSGAEPWRIRQIARRVDSWDVFYKRTAIQLAQSNTMDGNMPSMPMPDAMPGMPMQEVTPGMPMQGGMPGTDGIIIQDGTATISSEQLAPSRPANMVILDAVIINQETTVTSSTGVNLLSGLSLMFSGNLVDYARSRTKNYIDPPSSTSSRQTNNALTLALPAVTYSLNIANAQDSNNKLLARPSVLAYNGTESEVFIGTELTYTTAGENSNSFTKEVGLTLKATPEFDDEGVLKITVYTEFDAVASTAAPGTFSQSVATVKSRSNVVAEVEFGKTLVIGAGSTKRTTETENGVPVLKEIPIIRNLFNVESKSDQEASLLILITPRRPAQVNAATNKLENLIGNPGAIGAGSPELDALRNRHQDWWHPTSNVLKVLHGLRGRDILKEFRHGDIKFLDLDDDLSMEGSKKSPGPGGIISALVETMYY